MSFADPSIPVTEALARLPAGRLTVVPAQGGPPADEAVFSAVVIADPDDTDSDPPAGALVLGVGVRGRDAAHLVRAAGVAGAAGVVLRAGVLADQRSLRAAAARAGVVLVELASGARWDDVYADLLAVLRPDPTPTAGDDELTALAETVAALTDGLVTIEDTRSRVLAYSVSDDEVDELRRLSILGRNGPQAYLVLLREWGVYDRLATPDDVVEIDEHPETGIRRRLAVGIFAGEEQLGAIWVQQGRREFPARARDVLLGAARVAARELAQRRGRGGAGQDDGLAALLARRSGGRAVLGRALAQRPCVVAAFDVGGGPAERAAQQLWITTLTGVLRVHAAAFRASALVTQLDGRCYVLLPDVVVARSAVPMLRTAKAAARRRVGRPVRVALGRVVAQADEAAESRRTVDLVLDVARDPGSGPVTFDQVRAGLLADVAAAAARERADLFNPELAALGPRDAETLRVYLDCGSDVTAAANRLGLHPTTVRYRLRKLADSIDLSGPDARLAVQLQLRTASL